MTTPHAGKTTSAGRTPTDGPAPQAPSGSGSMIRWDLPGTGLVVHILAEHQWLVRDGSLPQTNAESLIGFIEKTGDVFQTTTLYPAAPDKHGFQVDTLPSLETAIRFLAAGIPDRYRGSLIRGTERGLS